MADTYVVKDHSAPYCLTFPIVAWVDVFTRPLYRDIVAEAFNYCTHSKGLQVYARVMMSNHVPCMLSSTGGTLPDTLRDFKQHTSKREYRKRRREKEKPQRMDVRPIQVCC